jgi:hypothetical protein
MRAVPITPPIQTVGRDQIIDEFGELDRRINEFRPVVARHKALKDEIAGWYSALAGDQTAVAEGKLYTIQIGRGENRRTITNVVRAFNLLKKAVGLETVLGLITIPLKVIDAHVSILDQRSIIKQERTGPRDIVAVAKAPIEAAKKAA